MFGTATTTLKVWLPYADRVRGTWSRGRCAERSDIEEPVCTYSGKKVRKSLPRLSFDEFKLATNKTLEYDDIIQVKL